MQASIRSARGLVPSVATLVGAVALAQGEPPQSVQGVWSGLFPPVEHPAWKIEDRLCRRCPLVQYRHLQSLLADPANQTRSLQEINAEAARVGAEHIEKIMTASHRERLSQYVPPADPAVACQPPALFEVAANPLPFSIEVHDDHVLVHQQYWNTVRRIALDGAPASPSAEASRFGSAIARFEGTTLIVESHNVPALTTSEFFAMTAGTTIIERYTPDRDGSRLEIETIVEDPASFSVPLVLHDVRVRTPDVELFDYEPCGERVGGNADE